MGEDQLLVGPQLLQPELGFCKILNAQYCVYLLTINIPQEIGENVLGLAGKELAVSHLGDGISIARLAYGTLFSSAFLIASLTASCTISTPTTFRRRANGILSTKLQFRATCPTLSARVRPMVPVPQQTSTRLVFFVSSAISPTY